MQKRGPYLQMSINLARVLDLLLGKSSLYGFTVRELSRAGQCTEILLQCRKKILYFPHSKYLDRLFESKIQNCASEKQSCTNAQLPVILRVVKNNSFVFVNY